MKLALNDRFGGFVLSDKARAILNWGSSERPYDERWTYAGYPWAWEEEERSKVEIRSNPQMIAVLEGMTPTERHASGGRGDSIRIVEVPDDAAVVYIRDYDGRETVVWSMSEIHHA